MERGSGAAPVIRTSFSTGYSSVAPPASPFPGIANANVERVTLDNGQPLLEATSRQPRDGFKRARLLVIDNFFPDGEWEKLLAFAIAQQPAFFPATVSEGSGYAIDESLRRARVVRTFGEVQDRMKQRIGALAPSIARYLGISERLGTVIEAEMTAYNEGDFFTMHADAGNERAARLISYVYYLCRDPKPFSGGQLRMFDSRALEDGTRDVGSAFEVDPLNNRIVLFASEHLHEVLPIRCASRQFVDSRFTINGWAHRN